MSCEAAWEGAAVGITPPFSGSPIEWMQEHCRLPHSDRSTRFDPTLAPWLNGVIELFCNDRVKQIFVRAPVGGAKTTLLELIIPFCISQQPGAMMAIGQTDKTAGIWAETRLQPVLKACAPVAALFPHDRHKKRKTEIIFPHMPLLLAGASLTSLQEKSCRYVFCDEAWRWAKGMLREALGRLHNRWNGKFYVCTQGWTRGHDCDGVWDSGQVHEWGTTCEGCGQWHKYLWSSIKWDSHKTEKDEHDWAKISESVRHECPECGHATANTTANRRAMAARASYRSEVGNFIEGHVSLTWSAMAVWWINWGELVQQRIRAEDAKAAGDTTLLMQFVQKVEARVWEQESDIPVLSLSASDYRKSDFAEGQPIDGEAYRFMTVDRQRDHYWVVIRAWRADGSSRLIWEGKVLTVETLRALQLQQRVKDKLVFMDAQYETGSTYEECSRWDWSALHGSGQKGFEHIGPRRNTKKFYSPAKSATAPGGGKCRYFFWSNEGIKDRLVQLRRQGAPVWEFPSDVSKDYQTQINSEVKRDVVNKQTGAVARRYVKFRENHMWDCEAMQAAVACMLGILPDMTEEELTPEVKE